MTGRSLLANLLALACLAGPAVAGASYIERDEVRAFAREMEEKHGFDAAELLAALHQVQPQARSLELIQPPTTPAERSWARYRARFLNPSRIDGGVAFWDENEAWLRRAREQYGVPEEVIVAIIGVETLYGRHTGNFETLSALTTLAFDYPPRAPLFRRELENLFLLARDQKRDPASYYGSYAGAVGYPQFLPSSIRHYGVDFDGNGRIDFQSDPVDAIGSVASYLQSHGWERDGAVAVRARVDAEAQPEPLIAAGIEPTLSPSALAAAGVAPLGEAPPAPATLVDLASPDAPTEYWLGYRNFYVITRYNKSSFYAMAVYELSQAVRKERTLQLARGAD